MAEKNKRRIGLILKKSLVDQFESCAITVFADVSVQLHDLLSMRAIFRSMLTKWNLRLVMITITSNNSRPNRLPDAALTVRPGAENGLHPGHQLMTAERFPEIPCSSQFLGLLFGRLTLAGGDEDHWETVPPGLQRLKQLKPTHAGHADIRDKTSRQIIRAVRQVIFRTGIRPRAVAH